MTQPSQPINKQRTAANLRQILSMAISVAYGVLIAVGDGGSLPTAVKAVIVAFGPAVVLLEHYVSDPSTGTPPSPPTPLP